MFIVVHVSEFDMRANALAMQCSSNSSLKPVGGDPRPGGGGALTARLTVYCSILADQMSVTGTEQ